MNDKPFIKVSLGIYIKNAKKLGPGPTSENWTINEKGQAPLSHIIWGMIKPLIELASTFMEADEILKECQRVATYLQGLEVRENKSHE